MICLNVAEWEGGEWEGGMSPENGRGQLRNSILEGEARSIRSVVQMSHI